MTDHMLEDKQTKKQIAAVIGVLLGVMFALIITASLIA